MWLGLPLCLETFVFFRRLSPPTRFLFSQGFSLEPLLSHACPGGWGGSPVLWLVLRWPGPLCSKGHVHRLLHSTPDPLLPVLEH